MAAVPLFAHTSGAAARRVLAVAIALTLAAGVFLVVGARRARVISVHDAVRDYRTQPTFEGLPGWAHPLDGARPAPGVYTYDTSGFAAINRLDVRRHYPALTARVVRHGPGCEWRETVAIFREHVETYSACAEGGDQLDTGFGTRLVYFFVPGVTDSVCDPAGTRTAARQQAGSSVTFRCRDRRHGVSVSGSARFLGEDRVRVGGTTVACRMVQITTVLRGSTVGGAVRTICTTPDTGLVLREERTVGLTVDSVFVGRVIYSEQATFTLRSLDPLR